MPTVAIACQILYSTEYRGSGVGRSVSRDEPNVNMGLYNVGMDTAAMMRTAPGWRESTSSRL